MDNQSNDSGANSSFTVARTSSNKGIRELLPRHLTSYKASASFAKLITILTISLYSRSRGFYPFTISSLSLHNRCIFPPQAFSEKSIKGQPIRVLNGRRTCVDAYLIGKWLKSSFNAIEKTYMKELIFEVLDDKDEILEYCSIQYDYTNSDVACSVSCDNITSLTDFDINALHESVSRLILSIHTSVEQLNPLPSVYKMQLRIMYYDERTPTNFVPEYFEDGDIKRYSIQRAFLSGKIKTPFHELGVEIASKLFDDDVSKTRELDLPSNGVVALPEPNEKKRKHSDDFEEPPSAFKQPMTKSPSKKPTNLNYLKEKSIANVFQQTDLSEQNGRVSNEEKLEAKLEAKLNSSSNALPTTASVNCICESKDERTSVFVCVNCKDSHHLICYKRKPTNTSPSNELACIKCALTDKTLECADPSLTARKLSPTALQDLAVYRLVLTKIAWFTLISEDTLKHDFKINDNQAKYIFSKLQTQNLLQASKRLGYYKIDSSKVYRFIGVYFR